MARVKVLIVADEGALALSLREKLEALGYVVVGTATTGEEALALAAAQRPEVVIMDIGLRGPLDGVETAAQMRARWRLPVIYLTSSTDEDILARAQKTEPLGYLLKPIREQELLTCIESAVHRHRTEQQLRASERRYAATLQSIGDALIAVDPAGRVSLMNNVAETLTGWPQDEAAGRPLAEVFRVIHAHTREPIASPVQRALGQGKPVGLENPALLLARDGRETPIADCAAPIQDPEDGLLGAVLVFRDVSDRERADAALRGSEERLRRVFDNVPDFISTVERDGRILFINRVLPGYNHERVLGSSMYEYIAAPYHAALRIGMERVFAARERHEFEIQAAGRPGELRWYVTRMSPILHEGQVTAALLIATDITERKQAEDGLRRYAAEVEDLYHNAPCGYHSLDADGTFVRINDTELRWLGYTREEILGRKNMSDFMTPERRAEFQQNFRAFRERGWIRDAEFELVRKDGTTLPVLLSASAIKDAAGQFVMSRATVYDLTERKRAEHERSRLESRMQEAQKLESLGVLAGGIAHDFNNLLTGILGYADLAQRSVPTASEARAFLDQVIRGARRAAELTQQMLAYSGKGQFLVGPVALSPLVRDMVELLTVSVSRKCSWDCQLAEPLPLIEADATQVRQVVMNVLLNAAEALGDQPGVVTVRTGVRQVDAAYFAGCFLGSYLPEGRYVYFEVADTGCGMTPATRARIFDPFFSTKFTGRGLGLAAVLGIARGHHSAIRVESEPGRGTTFTVLFPASSESAASAEPTVSVPAPWRGTGVVLLADDEPMIRDVAQRMLEAMGFTVLTAADGEEALDVFQKNAARIGLVLLDLTMPKMDGVEAIHELRRLRSDVPVLLCSGYGEPHLKDRLAGHEPAGFVPKPYRLDQMEEAVRRVLER